MATRSTSRRRSRCRSPRARTRSRCAATASRSGFEIWKTAITAKAASDYTFDPLFTPAKQFERQQRAAAAAPRPAPVDDTPVVVQDEKPAPPPEPEKTPIVVAPPPAPAPPPPPMPAPVVVEKKPEPVTPIVAKAPEIPAGPALVAPSAVTKISGETPHLGVSRNVDLPPVVTAKLCIDTDGKVTSAYAITKIERHSAEDLAELLKAWRYAPYKQKGVAVAACFAVSFRVK
jgi:hypothetical protein